MEAAVLGKEPMSFIMSKNRLLLGGAAALLLMIPAMASDSAAGMRAFRGGDYAAAYKEWKPLADKGDASAQCNLGIMYEKGLGVGKDASEALRLFQLAAEQ